MTVDEGVLPAPGTHAPASRGRDVWWLLGVAGLAATNVLVLSGMISGLRAAVAFATVMTVPGALAVRALRLRDERGWSWLLHVVALSLVGVMGTAFAVGLLPGGLTHPLACLAGFDVMVAALAAVAALAGGRRAWKRPWITWAGVRGEALGLAAGARTTPAAAVAVLLGCSAVVLSIIGARALNAGNGGGIAALGMACAACALAVAAGIARRHPQAAAMAVYLLGLAVLLATSLRGAGVTGHDIKLEYRVLAQTLDLGYWRPRASFAAYNSCLSITLLPAFLTRLLGIAPLDVFRVCFQVIFAMVPVGVIVVARRWVPIRYAVLGAGLFVAFPGFVNDMPMLNRQEIALIFFTVLVLHVQRLREVRGRRVLLLVILPVALAVSHYSTAYVAVALLLTAWLLRQVRRLLAREAGLPSTHRILGVTGAALLVWTIGWAVVTESASPLGHNLRDARDTVALRVGLAQGEARTAAPAGPEGSSDVAAFAVYVARLRPDLPPDALLSRAARCRPQILPSDLPPDTALGKGLRLAGLSTGTFNRALRSASAVLFEAGAILGAVLLLVREWRRRARRGRVPAVLAELVVAALALLMLPVVAPGLSETYGPQRLYQQLFLVLAPAVLVGLIAVTQWPVSLVNRWGGTARRARGASPAGPVTSTAIVVVCLLSTSGLVPTLTGGYPQQLNLSNAGPVFTAFYASDEDVTMASWIRDNLPASAVLSADSRDALNVRALTHLDPRNDLVPSVVTPDSYLLVRTMGGDVATAVAILYGRVVSYTFPLECVTADRRLLHVAGDHQLYGPERTR